MRFEDDKDLGHQWHSAMVEWDRGKMDRFDLDRFGTLGTLGLVGTYSYSYVDRTETAPYRTMARDYVLADRFFPTEFGPSFTAHQDLVAGRTRLDAERSLVDTPDGFPWGCDAPKGTSTSVIGADRRVTTNGPFPCLTQYATIADALDAKGVSWKYYTQALLTFGGQVWNAFDAIKRVRYGPDWDRSVIIPDTIALTDPGKGQLASVSFVIPDAEWADHPAIPTDYGPSWVGDVIDAIGESKYWKDTAIVVVWDDWGGWYDNVPPPQLDDLGLGIRTPMLIVSPYAKRGYVSHVQYEYGSILKFIESAFDLASLHSTDDRANNLLDAFDFTQKPRPFTHIETKYPRSFYLTIKQPRTQAGDDDDDER
jgi:phospholipase C